MSRHITSDPLSGQAEQGVQHDRGWGISKKAGIFLEMCLNMYLRKVRKVCSMTEGGE